MDLDKRWVKHERDGQSMDGYLAVPKRAGKPLPAVLVIQEIWGPDRHIVDVAERVAAAGYVALAPDLYSRGGRPEVFSSERIEALKALMETVPPKVWADPAESAKVLDAQGDMGKKIGETQKAVFNQTDHSEKVKDLLAWAHYLDAAPESRGMPLASIGFCMGGGLSFALAGSLPSLRAAMVFYGSAPSEALMEAIRCPVYGFYGETDARITQTVPDTEAAMARLGKTYEPKIYAGAGHAFFNDTRGSYHVDAARDAWARALPLFRKHLVG